MKCSHAGLFLAAWLAFSASAPFASAAESEKPAAAASAAPAVKAEKDEEAEGKSAPAAAKPSGPASKYPPFADVLKDFKPVDGLIQLYRKDARLLAEIEPGIMNRDLIVLISIARGIGEGQLLGGMSGASATTGSGSSARSTTTSTSSAATSASAPTKGSPEETAVQFAYTDSVLFSLPIIHHEPQGRRSSSTSRRSS